MLKMFLIAGVAGLATAADATSYTVNFTPGEVITLPAIDWTSERIQWAYVTFGGTIHFSHRQYGLGLDPMVEEYQIINQGFGFFNLGTPATPLIDGYADVVGVYSSNTAGSPQSYIDFSYDVTFSGFAERYDVPAFYGAGHTYQTSFDFVVGQGSDLSDWSDLRLNEATLNVIITPTPVVEPATWALMLGGFGLIGQGLRAKRKTALLPSAYNTH